MGLNYLLWILWIVNILYDFKIYFLSFRYNAIKSRWQKKVHGISI